VEEFQSSQEGQAEMAGVDSPGHAGGERVQLRREVNDDGVELHRGDYVVALPVVECMAVLRERLVGDALEDGDVRAIQPEIVAEWPTNRETECQVKGEEDGPRFTCHSDEQG
jgi:hypothetical protein